MRIIFIRHADTHNSKNGLYQNRSSSILNIDEADMPKISKALSLIKPGLILTSELTRSIETADLIDYKTERRKEPLLNEFCEPSSLAGKKIQSDNSYIFKLIHKYDEDPFYSESDGESMSSFIDRIKSFKLKYGNSDKTIICISHGFYMRMFLLLILTNESNIHPNIITNLFNLKLGKLNYSSFEVQNGIWSLESWNNKFI